MELVRYVNSLPPAPRFAILGAAAVAATFVSAVVTGGVIVRIMNARLRVHRVDMKGKVVIVTGGNRGIGLETSHMLAAMGARVIIACRDTAGGEQAAHKIAAATGSKVECWRLDLASVNSICEFSQKVVDSGSPLHVLICNAGLASPPRRETEDGNDLTLQVNHLGHFLLTSLLLPALTASGTAEAPSRVLTVSSELHRVGAIVPGDLSFRHRPWIADQVFAHGNQYANTKLMNVLFARELQRRLQARQSPVVAFSLQPGLVATDFGAALPLFNRLFLRVAGLLGYVKTPLQGALTSVYVATSPEALKHAGGYFADCAPARPHTPLASADQLAKQLWAASEELIGTKVLPENQH